MLQINVKKYLFSISQWWQVDKISPIKLYDENKSVAGFQLRHLVFKQGQYDYVKGVMNTLVQLYNTGKIRPIIDSAWAFEDVSSHYIKHFLKLFKPIL